MQTVNKHRRTETHWIWPGCQARFWLLLSVLALTLLGGVSAAQAVTLQDASFVSLPGGKVEVKLEFDAAPPAPKSYMIESPPRLVMDLWGAQNGMDNKTLSVKSGDVDSVNVAEANDRLRIVMNLTDSVGYKTRVENNSLYVELGGQLGGQTVARATGPATVTGPGTQPPASATAYDGTRVRGIDFKRLEGDRGRVIIDLSDARAGLDIVEEGNNIVVNLLGAQLSDGLEQRLDVQDFATPVLFIDSMMRDDNVSILIKPSTNPYDYMAYQSGNQLVLDFKPLTRKEQADQRDLIPYTGEKIDLNFQNVEIRTVLQIIAEVAKKNLVVSDNVQGAITLRLKNVPWDQALDIVLKTKGLDKRETGNVLLIGTVDEIAARETIEMQSQQQEQELAPLITDFIQIDYRKASDIKDRVVEAKLVSERGFVMADDETNTLMVRETAKQVEEIRNTIKQFDVEVAQVMVQARLVTASDTAAKELGVRWGTGYKGDNYVIGGTPSLNGPVIDPRFPPFTGGPDPVAPLTDRFGNRYTEEQRTAITEQLTYNKELNEFNAEGQYEESMTIPGNLMVDLGIQAATSGISLGFIDGGFLLSAELLAMQTDGKLEIVSQPKVMTTNGKKAIIQAGQEIPVQKTEDNTVTIEYKDVVLKLEVTPQIIPGDKISMDILINKDSLGGTLFENIIINKQELSTTVVVGDGETLVLGGILETEARKDVSKTPLLGDLPVIGGLFRSRSSNTNKRELLIFITPKMIRESLTGRQEIEL
jgi:type IV pilus assembly protein PilQ